MDLLQEKILTINGITKICSDTIYTYTDEDGNSDAILPYQWHLFQLHYILDHYKIPHYHPITKNLLTRSQIFKILMERNKSHKIDIIYYDFKKARRIGLVAKKHKNKYSIDNFGGLPKNDLKLDKNLNDVKWSDTNEYIYEDKYMILRTNQILKKKDVVEWIMNTTMRMENSGDYILDNPDKSLGIGRLDFYKNSSYADCILMLLGLYKNELDQLFLGQIKKYDKDFFEKNKNKLCIENTEENSTIILNYVLETFNELMDKLKKKEIFNSHKFLLSMKMCDDNNISVFGDSNVYDSINFLVNLFNILNIPIINRNITKTYYFNKGDFDIYQDLDSFTRQEIPATNSEGKPTYEDFGIEVEKGSNNKLMIFDIDLSQPLCIKVNKEGLKDKKNIFANLQLKIADTDEKVFDEECQIIIPKMEMFANTQNKIFNLQVNKNYLSDFICYKNQTLPKDFYFLNEDYEQLDSEIFRFYNKSDPNTILSEKDLTDDIGYKVRKIIQSYEIDDTNHYLFFNLLRGQRVGLRNNYLIPDEKIKINKKTYELQATITYDKNHFILFFKKENKWYLFDNMFDTIKRMDYMDLIDSYENLISYNNGFICRNGILHFYILK